ncbi:hypothetical protein BRD56_12940 [Thermoplasmatales archaeon SW_10_69_26]|nr:MAG: hypothetical protein BRD56_12940 [Thermoplasmatales archaeon SW_10_69_26]
MRTRTLIVVTLAALLLGAGLIVQAQDANDTDGESAPDEHERTVAIEREGSTVTLALERRGEPDTDPVTVGFDPPNATLDVAYGAGETTMTVAFEAIVEYTDDNGNGTYDFGEPIVSSARLSPTSGEANASEGNQTRWAAPIVTNATSGQAEGKRVVAPAEIPSNGTFTIEIEAYGERAQVRNVTLSPASVRVGLTTRGYDFQREDTELALFLAVVMGDDQTGDQYRARGERQRGFLTAEDVDDGSVNLLFAWGTTATVDGEQLIAQTTQLGIEEARRGEETQGEEGRRTAEGEPETQPWRQPDDEEDTERYVLSYPRGDRIEHAAEVEVGLDGADTTDDAPGVGLALTASMLLAAAALRRDR